MRITSNGAASMQLVTEALCMLAGFVCLAVYVPTLYASIPGGDSGELAAEGCLLGVAHPPGYPLIVWLYWLLSRPALAWAGPPAYRFNLASATAGAVAAWMVARTGAHAARFVRLTHCLSRPQAAGGKGQRDLPWADGTAGMLAGLVWGLSPLVWMYHVGAEVFALNNALVATLLALTADVCARAADGKVPGSLLVWTGALVSGLALSNQHTSVLALAVLVPAVFFAAQLHNRPAVLVGAAACTLLGLAPYAWLFVGHSYFRQPGSWGDCSSWAGWLHHVSRADYGTFQLYSGSAGRAESFAERTGLFATEVLLRQLPTMWETEEPHAESLIPSAARKVPAWAQMSLAVGIAAVAAALCMGHQPSPGATGTAGAEGPRKAKDKTKSKRRAADHATLPSKDSLEQLPPRSLNVIAVVVVSLAVYIAVFHGLSNMPLADPLLYGVHARFWMQPLMQVSIIGASAVALAGYRSGFPTAVNAACIALLSASTLKNWQGQDQSANSVIADYGRGLLESLPANATLLTSYDFQWTAARYLSACEGLRPDIEVLNAPMVSFKWFGAQSHLYRNAVFPGTHLVKALTQPHADGGFSLPDLVLANMAPSDSRETKDRLDHRYASMKVFKPRIISGAAKSSGALAIAGDVMHKADLDNLMNSAPKAVRSLPAGYSTTFRPSMTPVTCKEIAHAVTSVFTAHDTAGLQPHPHFKLDTWERATYIDSWTRTEDSASAILEESIAMNPSCIDGVVGAAALFEKVLDKTEALGQKPSASLLKNFGLALLHIVRGKSAPVLPLRLPLAATSLENLKSLAAEGVLKVWGAFLEHPDARSDSSFDTVQSVMSQLATILGTRS
ncbi:hypothetical protein FNF27_03222 [Cafeteria roenbergensis]|uniref:DUF2723 domain-containing protein n=1 Tax=Cafeteria roenbergensis TaxID=33653 RepID=A0A5A8EDD4_CAFRO|nr:hypothetical protein FNF27_03222 [Cafeteria roenbergensis]